MSGLDDILRSLPMDQLARQLGTDEATVSEAVSKTLPALLGGLKANAADAGGAASIQQAIAQHADGLFGDQIDLSQVDTEDGAKISNHIFGDNEDQVAHALGGAGGGAGGSLIKQLLPLLAPIVLSYLAKQMQGGGRPSGGAVRPSGGSSSPSLPTQTGGGGAGAPGSLEDMLGQVLGGGAGRAGQPSGQGGTGAILNDLLGGLLGGGRR